MVVYIPSFEQQTQSWKYTKREGNRFYFESGSFKFDVVLSGRELYDFIDRFDPGAVLSFQ